MSNWPELLFLYLIFSAVIAPGMVYVTYTYEPSDILGWISKAVFAVISFCFAVVFTPSIIFILFYRWLYRKHCSRKAAQKESSNASTPKKDTSPKSSVIIAVGISILASLIYYISVLAISILLVVVFILLESIPLVGTLLCVISNALSRATGIDSYDMAIFFGMLSGARAVCWITDKMSHHSSTSRLSIIITSSILFVLHISALISNLVRGETIFYVLQGFLFVYYIFHHRKSYSPSSISDTTVTNLVPDPSSRAPLDSSTDEAQYLMEAANGTLVRVPESKLEQWQYYQEHPEENPILQHKEEIINEILDSIYGPQDNSKQ